MKVLQVNALGSTLSTGRTTREMHEYFERRGIDSYIATAYNKDCDDAYRISTLNAMHIDTLFSIITGLEGYHSHRQTRRFLKYIDKIKPDIVHLRNLHNSYINLGMLLKYLAKKNIPTVITLHDFWFMTGKCCFYTRVGCNKWESGCGNCPHLLLERRRFWFDRTQRMWRDKKRWFASIPRLAVVGVSDWVADEARRAFFKKSAIIRRIYNWIDQECFCPRETQELRRSLGLENKFVIFAVATWWSADDRKNLESYLSLAKALPDDCRIVLLGQMNYAQPLPPNVISLPPTNDKDLLAQYYSMADVYLNLSMEETFGKVSAEAVSCGTPLIAYDSTANKEIVPPNGGFLVSSLDVSELMEAICSIRTKPKEYYTPLCREYAKKYFDKDTNLEEYVRLYEELIGSEDSK